MLRVLLVTDTDKPIGDLRDALARLGYDMLAGTTTSQALHRRVESERPDIIIIDTESPSRDTLEQLAVMKATAPRPVLMFSNDANQQLIRDAVSAGVTAYLVEGLATEKLAPILEVALARFAQETGRAQADRPRQTSADGSAEIDRTRRLCEPAQACNEPGRQARRGRAPDRHGRGLAQMKRGS
jgi:response regulator NasT